MDEDLRQRMLTYYDERAPEYDEVYTLGTGSASIPDPEVFTSESRVFAETVTQPQESEHAWLTFIWSRLSCGTTIRRFDSSSTSWALSWFEDVPALTNDGRAKRWVIVRPAGGETGILLARANDDQAGIIGQQFAGRVGFFLRVDDFEASYNRMSEAGVRFASVPRVEPYGKVAVFLDLDRNRWDLLGPDPSLRTDEDSRRGTPG